VAGTAEEELPEAVAAAAAAAVAEPMLWAPPSLQLQQPELQQSHFDSERYLWVPEPATMSE
jgi:hypothetical protein